MKDLKKEIEDFEGCSLKKTATNLVFSDGNSNAKVMLIGEAPGKKKIKQVNLLKGKQEFCLDKMLNAIGQNRNNTYITNLFFGDLQEIEILLMKK